MGKLKPKTSVGHRPGSRWAFDAGVTDCFDDMLRRSIPHLDTMREACFEIAAPRVQPDTDIVDIGCSRGSALAPFVARFGTSNRLVGLEISRPMLAAARARYAAEIAAGVVRIEEHDLRRPYPLPLRASVTLAILTLQFVPIEYRLRLVREIYQTITPGGALVVVEKIMGAAAGLDELMVSRYYALKARNGYSTLDITRKRHALEGVLVPVTAKWNEDLLRLAGFREVDCFWRWMNFAGWVALK
jgi:tRNA (cmo5U34)-methyltransferase